MKINLKHTIELKHAVTGMIIFISSAVNVKLFAITFQGKIEDLKPTFVKDAPFLKFGNLG